MRTELAKKRKVDGETSAGIWIWSKKQHKMDAWRDYTSHEIDVCKELNADFNLPKIHWMTHRVEQIHRYGALQQYSAERHEEAHNMQLKDGWNASNHNLNSLPQVITFQRHIHCLEMTELNLEALAQCRENSPAACNFLPSDADVAAPLGSQSFAVTARLYVTCRALGNTRLL